MAAQAHEDGDLRLAHGLEGVGGHVVHRREDDTGVGHPEPSRRHADQLGVPGGEEPNQELGGRLDDEEASAEEERRQDEGDLHRPDHPLVVPGAEVVADDGLNPAGEPQNGEEEEAVQAEEDAHGRDGHVPAVPSEQPVEEDEDEGEAQLREKGRETDGEDPTQDIGARDEVSGSEAELPHPGQIVPGGPEGGDALGEHRGQGRASDAHPEGEDEEGIQQDVHHSSQHEAEHGEPGAALRPDEVVEAEPEGRERDPPHDDAQILPGHGHQRGRHPREGEDLLDEKTANDGGQHPSSGEQEQGVAHGPLRPAPSPLAEGDGDEGAGSHTYEGAEGDDQHHEGKAHGDGPDPHGVHSPPDEDPVHDIIESVRHHPDDPRQGKPQDKPGEGLRPHGGRALDASFVHCRSSVAREDCRRL